MPLFGNSAAGNEAEGWPREFGAWTSEQFKQMLARAGIKGADADRISGEMQEYWKGQMESQPGVGDIRKTGQEISPWVDQYASDSGDRLRKAWEYEDNVPTAGDTAGKMRANIVDRKARNEGNKTDLELEIGGTADRAMGRSQSLFDDSTALIRGTSGALQKEIKDTYGGLRADNAKTFADLQATGDTAFTDQLKDLALLAPGGEFSAARSGRAFAPQVADAMGRMRRAGIDPNSPEAAAQLRAIESERSRAMDDTMADTTKDYVTRKTSIGDKKLDFTSGVARDRLGNEIKLGTDQSDRTTKVMASEGDQLLGVRTNLTTQQQGIDAARSQARRDLIDKTFGREQDLSKEESDTYDYERKGGQTDADRRKELLQDFNENDLIVGGLKDNQFSQGNAFVRQGQQAKNEAAKNYQGIGTELNNDFYRTHALAGGYGSTAMDAYSKAYGYELPNSNLFAKIVGPMLGAIPVVGPALAAGAGALTGTPAGGAAPSTPGATPSFNPNAATQGYQNPASGGGNPLETGGGNWLSSLLSRFRQRPTTPYDPSKTRTLPNGDLQVGTY